MIALTADRLRELLDYDPETGVFTWRVSRSNVHAGTTAGSAHRVMGYRLIRVDGHKYMAHRLAWLYTTGRWPLGEIDHINRDGLDNRIVNLRDASRSQNAGNQKRRTTNTSGLKGASPLRGKWQGKICVRGEQIYLGLFDTPEAAHAAYCAAAEKHFGEFARTA